MSLQESLLASLYLECNPGYLWTSCWVVTRGLVLKAVNLFSIVGHLLMVLVLQWNKYSSSRGTSITKYNVMWSLWLVTLSCYQSMTYV